MFKDRMEGANVTKGAIIVGGNAYLFVARGLGNGLEGTGRGKSRFWW